MKQSLTRLLFAVALLTSTASLALAQGASATTSLAGAVVDKDGGVIPGAPVAVKNNGTGVTPTAVTNGSGAYSFPTLDAGTYTVTISLSGFMTVIVRDTRLLAGTPQPDAQSSRAA